MKNILRTVSLCRVLPLFAAMPSLAAMLIGQNILWFGRHPGAEQEGGDVFKATVNFATTDNPWRPEVITELKPFALNRFMDGSMIVINKDSVWMNRVQRTDKEQDCDWADNEGRVDNGMAYEWQIDLCNRIGRDYWLNIPYKAPRLPEVKVKGGLVDYALRLAILIKHGVDMKTVSLTPMMDKLSTMTAEEFIAAGGVRTSQGLNPELHFYIEYTDETWLYSWGYVEGMAKALDASFGGADYTAIALLRSAASFYKVFGADSPRVRPVFSGQYSNPWHSEQHVKMISNATYNPEKMKIYGIAMAPYYEGFNQAAIAAGTDAYTLKHRKTATSAGIKLLCYEGGVQGIGTGGITNGGRPQLYNEYLAYLAGLEKMGVDEFVHYGYAGAAGWGSKEFIGQPLAEAHKYRALLDVANKNNPPPVGVRQPVQRAVAVPNAAVPVGRAVVDIRGRQVSTAARYARACGPPDRRKQSASHAPWQNVCFPIVHIPRRCSDSSHSPETSP